MTLKWQVQNFLLMNAYLVCPKVLKKFMTLTRNPQLWGGIGAWCEERANTLRFKYENGVILFILNQKHDFQNQDSYSHLSMNF